MLNKLDHYGTLLEVTEETNHTRGLEAQFLVLSRAAAENDLGAVRQLLKRLVRNPPNDVANRDAFRHSLADSLSRAARTTVSPFRAIPAEEIPTDEETGFSLAVIDTNEPEVPILPAALLQQLEMFVTERRRMSDLIKSGIPPSRSVLLLGPPGTGKTLTARYLAAQLDLPLVVVDLASVMSSYLGKTGQNLRRALEYAKTTQCVLLLDEFDALAKRRDDDSDIGELKRLVNVLLLELERWPTESVLVAASNHPELLDRAVSRRFDLILRFELPDSPQRAMLIDQTLGTLAKSVDPKTRDALSWATDGWSGSDIARLTQSVVRTATLTNTDTISLLRRELGNQLKVVAKADKRKRDEICRVASNVWHMSNREIGELLGIGHPTVGRILQRS